MTVVLGIKPTLSKDVLSWGGHDPGACLLSDDGIIAMAEEERFNRIKRSPNPSFPTESIRYVLREADITLSAVDAIAIGRDQRRYVNFLLNHPKKLLPTSIASSYSTILDIARVIAAYKGVHGDQVADKIQDIFEEEYNGRWYQISHHRCHAASAAYCSSFSDQVVLTIDGAGEDDSTVLWDTNLNRVRTFSKMNSIGKMYSAGCNYLGFRGFRDAGKVMGLASYGNYREDFADIFDELVSVSEGSYDVSAVQKDDYSAFEDQFGPRRVYPNELTQRHKDFAYHLQLKTEQIVTSLVKHHVTSTGISNVALSGGVAMNCKLNRKILNMECVNDLFVQPAANDPGICLGAALEGYALLTGKKPNIRFDNIYYGPNYSNKEIKQSLDLAGISYEKTTDICGKVARLLAEGKIVGWFQGRMEFGARALGNRSILANPTSRVYRDEVNRDVKHRESWRPFAPSLLYRARDEYLENGDEAPYMILLDSVRESKRDEIPAVTHVDGTTRPQTVRKEVNPRYYSLLEKFEELTGVPVLLNTSFNVAGEPIVMSPKHALSDFFITGLDALAIGDFIVQKSAN